ncbi:uncharacterized protein LOC115961748 [Quercus lobata]|uniref:uncharacterized protein LOC115961748 n=1 Tax=Quercus lobata TaxID=97700 RepID=UPI001247A3FB|nr:uncharacterized protein LOC115961748 [Quercus lobata]
MAISDGGPVFIKAIDGSSEFKDKHYIAGVLKDVIKEIGHEKVVQVITDNANVMKSAGVLIEAKNTEKNEVTYEEYSWITRIADDASFIRVFIMNHSMRYYSIEWLSENPKRISPHRDHKISMERSKCLDRYFEDENELKVVKFEFAAFSGGRFPSPDALTDRWALLPLVWWQYHGSAFPTLQTPALKLLGQPCSSSCTERNWSTYKFIHSLKRNKMPPTCAEDLVYVHSNFRLLSRCNEEYVNTTTKMLDIARDSWNENDIHGGAGILENAALTLDEPELEAMVIGNASTSVTTSESEVRNEAIDLDDDDVAD